MWQDKNELLFDLVTRDALLVWEGQLYKLDGPFKSEEDALAAAEQLKRRMFDLASAV